MSRFVPVSFEKWAAMVQAQSDLVRYKEICDELDAECTRLKAEVDKYRNDVTASVDTLIDERNRLKAEVERLASNLLGRDATIMGLDSTIKCLKAEVERLTALVESNLNQSKRAMANSDAYVRSLEAQVERLTKAGDNLVYVVTEHPVVEPFVKAWFAAKEGKQP
jgi:chromosome segregation ATPase